MPGMDGYAAARKIRDSAAETGWGQEGDKARAVEAGFDHHFTKPVDTDRLLALM